MENLSKQQIADKIAQGLKTYLENAEAREEHYRNIRALIAEKFTGKTLSKRIATAYEAAHPDQRCTIERSTNMIQSKIVIGKARDYRNNTTIYLSAAAADDLSPEALDKDNPWAQVDHAGAYRKALNDKQTIEATAAKVEQIRKLWKELYNMDSNAGGYIARELTNLSPKGY